jgi:hypothetical protein
MRGYRWAMGQPGMARPEGVGLARHVVPPGPCLLGPLAWPLVQARQFGLFSRPPRSTHNLVGQAGSRPTPWSRKEARPRGSAATELASAALETGKRQVLPCRRGGGLGASASVGREVRRKS